MKKTQEIRIISNKEEFDAVLEEATKFSNDMELSYKDSLRIRLLTEETMAMVRTLTGELDLMLSFIGQDDECIIKVETDTVLDPLKKVDILSVSPSGKNASAKGIMGKVRDAFETAFMLPQGSAYSEYASPSLTMGMPVDVYTAQFMDTVYWSLSDYKNNVGKEGASEEHKERWDELEKSIVNNIADDVQVGVKGNHVVMTISYKTSK